MKDKLVLGKIVVADKIAEAMKEDKRFYHYVCTCLGKYMNLDWGETDEHGKDLNADGLLHEGLIRALYGRGDEKILITTDKNRQFTTINFNEE